MLVTVTRAQYDQRTFDPEIIQTAQSNPFQASAGGYVQSKQSFGGKTNSRSGVIQSSHSSSGSGTMEQMFAKILPYMRGSEFQRRNFFFE